MSEPVIDGLKNEPGVFGFFVIFRILLGAAVYHLLQSIALLGVNTSEDRRSILQDGLWPIKVFTLIGCVTVCFYISPQYFRGIFYLSLAGATFCTLIQAFLLIDVAYEYAEYFVEQYEETGMDRYKYILIGTTVFFNGVLVVGSGWLFFRYPGAWDRVLVVGNLLISASMTILSAMESIQELNPKAGIFQSSLLGAYNFYLVLSGLLSRPIVPTIAPSLSSEHWIQSITTFGYFMAIFFAAFSAFRTGQASHKLLITRPIEKDEQISDGKNELDDYSRSFFHFIFLLSALQLAILMNLWRAPEIDHINKILRIVDLNISFYVKISTSFIITILYTWTLFAPHFFPDREFY
jgi:serine incorporator 1/3